MTDHSRDTLVESVIKEKFKHWDFLTPLRILWIRCLGILLFFIILSTMSFTSPPLPQRLGLKYKNRVEQVTIYIIPI